MMKVTVLTRGRSCEAAGLHSVQSARFCKRVARQQDGGDTLQWYGSGYDDYSGRVCARAVAAAGCFFRQPLRAEALRRLQHVEAVPLPERVAETLPLVAAGAASATVAALAAVTTLASAVANGIALVPRLEAGRPADPQRRPPAMARWRDAQV